MLDGTLRVADDEAINRCGCAAIQLAGDVFEVPVVPDH